RTRRAVDWPGWQGWTASGCNPLRARCRARRRAGRPGLPGEPRTGTVCPVLRVLHALGPQCSLGHAGEVRVPVATRAFAHRLPGFRPAAAGVSLARRTAPAGGDRPADAA